MIDYGGELEPHIACRLSSRVKVASSNVVLLEPRPYSQSDPGCIRPLEYRDRAESWDSCKVLVYFGGGAIVTRYNNQR